VAEALFPAQGGGALDGHHAFIVQYKQVQTLHPKSQTLNPKPQLLNPEL